MPRISKTEQELNYLRSAWEEIEYANTDIGFIVDVYLSPTISRGVWSVVVMARSREEDEHGLALMNERAIFRFPNGRMVTFAGELWAVLHKFNVQLEEARDRWTRAQAK